MANPTTPFGLVADKYTFGEIPTQKVYFDADDATACFIGDGLAADQTNGGDSLGTPAVVQAAAGGVLFGVLVAIAADTSVSGAISDTKYRLASTAAYGLAIASGTKGMTFLCREDSVGGALTADSVGLSCDLIVGTGSTTTGKSSMMIDSSSAGATGQVTLIEPVQTIDNALGTNAVWRVQINESLFV